MMKGLAEQDTASHWLHWFNFSDDHLKMHMMLLHSGEKPFVCNQCGYSTIKDDHLKMHMTVTVHNAQFVQYLYLATEQAGTYLKSGPV